MAGMESEPRRRRLQFSLRMLLVTVAFLGGLIALSSWIAHSISIVREREEARIHVSTGEWSVIAHPWEPPKSPTRLPWIRTLMGDVPMGTMVYYPDHDRTGENLPKIRRIFPEAEIWCFDEAKKVPFGMKRLSERQ